MVKRRVILAAFLLASGAARAFGPVAIDDMMAGLVATASPGGYSDAITAGGKATAYWTVKDSTSLSLSGTSVLSWTDLIGGRVAAATNANMRPTFSAAAFGGNGALVFAGTNAMDFLSTPVTSTNSTTIAVLWRSSATHVVNALARGDSDGGPMSAVPWNNGTVYFHPGANGYGNSKGSFAFTGTLVMASTHTGGNVTTNNTLIYLNGTNVGANTTYSQASGSNAFTRIGGRRNQLITGRICAIAHFTPNLTEAEIQTYSAALAAMFEGTP